jgi:hypothetical protein
MGQVRSMQTRKNILSALSTTLAALLVPIAADACSLVYPTAHVGPEFRVQVTDRGRPVQGLQINLVRYDELNSGSHDVSRSVTDPNGFVQFHDLTFGSFFVSAHHDGGMADGVIVKIEPDGPHDAIVQLKWPNSLRLRVTSVKGALRTADYYPQQTQAPLSLSLLEGLSARVVVVTQSDNKGRFIFPNVAPGIYFIRLNAAALERSLEAQDENLIPVDVSPDAKRATLDLDLAWTSCGLSYADQAECPQTALVVGKVCGAIADVTGAVISNAEVLLLTNEEQIEVLDKTHSDRAGHFTLEEARDGSYQVVIKERGFHPLHRIVNIHAEGRSKGCRRPIEVRLGVADSCSTAGLSEDK